jgi:serine/threonine protein kinase
MVPALRVHLQSEPDASAPDIEAIKAVLFESFFTKNFPVHLNDIIYFYLPQSGKRGLFGRRDSNSNKRLKFKVNFIRGQGNGTFCYVNNNTEVLVNGVNIGSAHYNGYTPRGQVSARREGSLGRSTSQQQQQQQQSAKRNVTMNGGLGNPVTGRPSTPTTPSRRTSYGNTGGGGSYSGNPSTGNTGPFAPFRHLSPEDMDFLNNTYEYPSSQEMQVYVKGRHSHYRHRADSVSSLSEADLQRAYTEALAENPPPTASRAHIAIRLNNMTLNPARSTPNGQLSPPLSQQANHRRSASDSQQQQQNKYGTNNNNNGERGAPINGTPGTSPFAAAPYEDAYLGSIYNHFGVKPPGNGENTAAVVGSSITGEKSSNTANPSVNGEAISPASTSSQRSIFVASNRNSSREEGDNSNHLLLGSFSRKLTGYKSAIMNFDDLEVVETLGTGGFFRVYKMRDKKSNREMAVKLLIEDQADSIMTRIDSNLPRPPTPTLTERQIKDFRAEAETMLELSDKNIVQFYGICLNPPAIVTEILERGSLFEVLKSAREAENNSTRWAHYLAQLNWRRRLNMLRQAAQGMAYVHSKGIIHCDLKSPNLLVDESLNVKVADFNLRKVIKETGLQEVDITTSLSNVSPLWAAPELTTACAATKAIDIYSFGIIMWEMMHIRRPWHNVGQGDLQIRGRVTLAVSRGERPAIDLDGFPGRDDVHVSAILSDYIDLMMRCWDQLPRNRPSFSAVADQIGEMITAYFRSMKEMEGSGKGRMV